MQEIKQEIILLIRLLIAKLVFNVIGSKESYVHADKKKIPKID